jgi:hypothetical protein
VESIPEQGRSAAVAERLEMLGGKGANQAVGMAQLGLHVSLVAAVGDDEAGGRLLDQAAADGIDISAVARRPGAPTALIVSIVEAGGWRYLEHIPPAVLLSSDDIQRAAPAFRSAGTVVIQLQQPAQAALAAAGLGRRCGCRVVLDGALPQEYTERLLATSDVVRADAREAELLTGHRIRNAMTPSPPDARSCAVGLRWSHWPPARTATPLSGLPDHWSFPSPTAPSPTPPEPVTPSSPRWSPHSLMVSAPPKAASRQPPRQPGPSGTSADGPAASPGNPAACPGCGQAPAPARRYAGVLADGCRVASRPFQAGDQEGDRR